MGLGLFAGALMMSCSDSPSRAAVPEGFDTASVRIRRDDGSVCELCTYVARTGPERQQGLMNVTGLDGHDGMLFVFDAPGVQDFWMRNTLLSLSAAWFGGDGSFRASFDMDPCPADVAECPLYGPNDPVLHVLEVPQGDLARLGIGVGAVLESVGPPCEPSARPAD